ncbi:hypothetical protein JCM11641_001179 [Rhodosporidiobolus odoratus]
MYDSFSPAFGERVRSFSAGSVLQSQAAPTGRTIYSYSTPSSPYASYEPIQPPQQGYFADLPEPACPVSTPCSCADCWASTSSASSTPAYYPSLPYASTSTFVVPSLPCPPETYPSYETGPTEVPLHRPIPRRPTLAQSLPAPVPALPSPPLEEQLRSPEPLYYQTPLPPAPSPPYLQPAFEESTPLGGSLNFSSRLDTPLNPSHLLTPFSLDRRRSSGGSPVYSTCSHSRRGSARSSGSPRQSERSFGSEDGEPRIETVTPFVNKLSQLLSNPETDNVIRWNAAGTAFVFATSSPELGDAFSKVFRHNNTHSFVRQLNIYDFKRLSTLEIHAAYESVPQPPSDLTSTDFAGFSHPLFFRDSPERGVCNLAKIKPKPTAKPPSAKSAAVKVSPYCVPSTSKARTLRSDGTITVTTRRRKL